ncbi:MAG: TRAP transporter small permease, partial [Candidatus Bathyarchaeota archaeon]|nr:TRAP transporter small permease [Candidatus Bathyarchaeum sp.]
MSETKQQFNGVLDQFGKIYKYVCAMVLAGMVLTVFVNTVLRYGFNYGLALSEEALRYLFVWLSYLGIVAVYKSHSHISVTIITERLSKKASLYFSFFSNILVIYAFCVLIRGGIIYMQYNM